MQHRHDSTTRRVSVDDVLNEIGFGRFHWKLLFICGFGWAADNMWLTSISFILLRVQPEWKLSDTIKGLTGSSMFLGTFCGAYVWGYLSDRIGRKPSFTWTLAIASAGGFASACAPNFWSLMIFLFLLGFGVGGNLPVDGALFSEMSPLNKRWFLSFMAVFWSVGAVFTAGLAWVLVPRIIAYQEGWRWLQGILAVCNGLFFLCRAGIPESPRFLIVRGRYEEAEKVLLKIATLNKVQLPPFKLQVVVADRASAETPLLSQPHEEEGSTVINSHSVTTQHATYDEVLVAADGECRVDEMSSSYRPLVSKRVNRLFQLFQEPMTWTSIILLPVWFFTSLGFGGFSVFLPSFFEDKGIPPEDIYRNTFLMQAGGIPGILLATWLVETFLGRKWTMSISLIISGVAIYMFVLTDNGTQLLVFSVLMSFFSMLAYSAQYTITPELYPTSMRTMGVGACSCLNRSAAILSPLLSGGLVELSDSVAPPLTVYALSFLVAGVLSIFLPETRGIKLSETAEDEMERQQLARTLCRQKQEVH